MDITLGPAVIPGPPPLPLVGPRGNFLRFLLDPLGYTVALHRRYGGIVRLTRFDQAGVFAFGPRYNRQVLADAELFRSPSFINFPAPEGSPPRMLDAGLISMNGAQHKQHRRLMQPAFHKKHVEGYRDAMVAIIARVLEGWRPGQRLDLAREMQLLTLRVAGKTLFGFDDIADAARLGDMVKRWLGILFSPELLMLPLDLPGSPYRRMLAHAAYTVDTYREMIARKRAGPPGQDDVVAALIQVHDEDGTRLSDAELIGHAHNLFVAGHDSSATALTWALFLLAQHPRVYADLLDELAGALRGDAPTVEQLDRLPLLERVVKETLRLLPPATLGRRDAAAPFALGPYELPAGTVVFISPYVTHHLPELYPEPQRFQPERWGQLAPSPYEYLPFGLGPHMCIGSSFALLEIKVALAMIVQRYRLTVAPGARIDRQIQIFMGPRRGMPMEVAAQDRRFARVAVRGNIHEMVDLHGE